MTSPWAAAGCAALGLLLCSASGIGQQGAAVDPASQVQVTQPPAEALRSILPVVRASIDQLEVGHWKLSGEMKSETEINVESVRRDLIEALPGLLDQARDASAQSGSGDAIKGPPLGPGWAVYRNVDALYDVLLRVQQVAQFAAPRTEAASLTGALDRLGAARKDLGNLLMQQTTAQDVEVRTLRSAQVTRAVAPAPTPAPQKIVVEDGAAAAPPKARKRAPAKPDARVRPAAPATQAAAP